MADAAEAGTPNCRESPVDLNPVPEQQHVAAEHIQEYPPDVQQPAPDELEAQQPGRQAQQHATIQQPLQQRQERLHPQQQQTQLRHDAPSWEMGRCAVPAYGEQASVPAVKAEKEQNAVMPSKRYMMSTHNNLEWVRASQLHVLGMQRRTKPAIPAIIICRSRPLNRVCRHDLLCRCGQQKSTICTDSQQSALPELEVSLAADICMPLTTVYVRDTGIISGELKVRGWEGAPAVGAHSALPQHLLPPVLPQMLPLQEQQPYTPPQNEQQLYTQRHLPPLRPPPLHAAQLQPPPTHMRQHPMPPPPAPQQLGDGRDTMQQQHEAWQEGDGRWDMPMQGGASSSGAWTPMCALSQTQHPAHEYGGVAQLPLEPYHSAGDESRRHGCLAYSCVGVKLAYHTCRWVQG